MTYEQAVKYVLENTTIGSELELIYRAKEVLLSNNFPTTVPYVQLAVISLAKHYIETSTCLN